MAKYLPLLLFVFFQNTFAQSYDYGRDTVLMDGGRCYYIKDRLGFAFDFVNSAYTLYDQQMTDFQGNVIHTGEYYGSGVVIDSFWQAFTETFTEEEIAVMRDANPRTIIYIFVTKDNTGKALEVVFTVWKRPGVINLPPERWAQYEQNIKTYLRWNGITEDERNAPFSHHFYRIDKRDLVRRFAVLPDVEPINPM